MKSLRTLALVFTATLFAGCGTYTNVPSQTADIAENDPNTRGVYEVIIPALRGVLADRPIAGNYTVVLPGGTLPKTYDLVVPRIGPGAVWSSSDPPQHPVIEVRQVRIRGLEAEVDVVRPSDDGSTDAPRALVTAFLKWDFFTSWNTYRVRTWRVGVGNSRVDTVQE